MADNIETMYEYSYEDYIVKDGDTFASIAEAYGITDSLIMFINNTNTITVGQTLRIPKPKQNTSKEYATEGIDSIETTHSTMVEVSHPTIQVEFFGEYGKLASVSTTDKTEDLEVDNDIVSVTTTRGLGQDCPTFSMNLVWRNKWYTNLASNDLIIIYMYRPPEKRQAVFFGLIDDIRKSTDFASGQPQRTVQVTGRGFSKAFVSFDVGLIDRLAVMGSTMGFFDDLQRLVSEGNNSYNAIQLVLNSYIGKAIKYYFGNGKVFEDYFVYSGNEHEHERLVDYKSYTTFKGSLWNFIKELSNTPFNETYWEIVDDKPNLIHRRTPFNKEDWLSLPRITIEDCDLVSDNTGRSDLETYSLFIVTQRQMSIEMSTAVLPLWYPPYYSKYGLTNLEVSTVYVPAEYYNTEAHTQLQYDLFNWNIKNNIFENGTLVVKGKAQYKIGQRVILESSGVEYYVESVTHNFTCFGGWTTQLGVTRGILPNNRFTAPWGCAERLSPATISAIRNQTKGEIIDWSNLPEVSYNSKDYQESNIESYTDGQYTWAVKGHTVISSPFGNRDNPVGSGKENHKGIDIPAPIGTPIVAIDSGKVISAGKANGYGQWVRIQHSDGTVSIYGHISSYCVKVGDRVKSGQTIATVGNAGQSTGPHLHLQVEKNGIAVDPLGYYKKTSPNGTDINLSRSDTQDACYKYLTSVMGLNCAGACAVMGNINQESGFKCKIDGDNGTSYGLCQWHNDRKTNLISYCKSLNKSINSVEGQLAYLEHELKNSYKGVYNKLKSTPNTPQGAYDSAYYFCIHFEVPQYKEQKGIERGNTAKEFFKRYS